MCNGGTGVERGELVGGDQRLYKFVEVPESLDERELQRSHHDTVRAIL
jgi:hypothetical protein